MIVADPGNRSEQVIPSDEAITDDPSATPELVKRTAHEIESSDMSASNAE